MIALLSGLQITAWGLGLLSILMAFGMAAGIALRKMLRRQPLIPIAIKIVLCACAGGVLFLGIDVALEGIPKTNGPPPPNSDAQTPMSPAEAKAFRVVEILTRPSSVIAYTCLAVGIYQLIARRRSGRQVSRSPRPCLRNNRLIRHRWWFPPWNPPTSSSTAAHAARN